MRGNRLELPVGPFGVRLFIGYRAQELADQPGDDAEVRATKRARFFTELGGTFMPGTPLMQAPIGLAAYLPAVIDPPSGSGLPDEVAAIVYASREVYDRFREISLSRRMYTRSHVAVFDMGRSIAQFPVADVDVSADHHFTFLSADAVVDWQSGSVRVLFVVPKAPNAGFQQDLLKRLATLRGLAETSGVHQVLMASTKDFAAFWIHSEEPIGDKLDRLDLLPSDAQVLRNLEAVRALVVGDTEKGVTVTGPAAFTFRFERRLEFFDGLRRDS